MENLEGISFEEAIHPDGTSYAVFRRKIKPAYAITWANIITALTVLVVFFILFTRFISAYPVASWLLIPAAAFVSGVIIAFINLFIHEAGHYYIYPNRKWNDALANILLCSWMGVDIKIYRKIHWKHHLHLSGPEDTENSYFDPLTPSLILETLTGIHLLRIIISKNDQQLLNRRQRKRSLLMLLAGLVINVTLIFLFIYFKYPQAAIAWIMAMVIFFPFFATIRQLLEHRSEAAGASKDYYKMTRPRISRIFTNSPLSQVLGAAGFNKHMIHHWDPDLPFTGLRQAEEFLVQCEKTKSIILDSRTSYLKTFKKLFTSTHG